MGKENKLNRALGDWDESSSRVKDRIRTEIANNEKCALLNQDGRPKGNWKLALMSSSLLIAMACTFWFMLFTEKEEPVALDNQLNETDVVDVPDKSGPELRKPSDLAIRIAQYEMFHEDRYFISSKEAKYYGLKEILDIYAFIDKLEGTNIAWDDEKRAFYREQVKQELEALYEWDIEQLYTEKLLAYFNITEDEYIDEYLLPLKEGEILGEEWQKARIGLPDGRSSVEDEQSNYYQQLGYTDEVLNRMANFEMIDEALASQTYTLPFIIEKDVNVLIKNEAGEYVFIYPTEFKEHLSDVQLNLYKKIQDNDAYDEDFLGVNRKSFNMYYDKVRATKGNVAGQLLEIMDIYKRSVEWAYEE